MLFFVRCHGLFIIYGIYSYCMLLLVVCSVLFVKRNNAEKRLTLTGTLQYFVSIHPV